MRKKEKEDVEEEREEEGRLKSKVSATVTFLGVTANTMKPRDN